MGRAPTSAPIPSVVRGDRPTTVPPVLPCAITSNRAPTNSGSQTMMGLPSTAPVVGRAPTNSGSQTMMGLPPTAPVVGRAPSQQLEAPVVGRASTNSGSQTMMGLPSTAPVVGRTPTRLGSPPVVGHAPTNSGSQTMMGLPSTAPVVGRAPSQQLDAPVVGRTPTRSGSQPVAGRAPTSAGAETMLGLLSTTPVAGRSPTGPDINPLSQPVLAGPAVGLPAVSRAPTNSGVRVQGSTVIPVPPLSVAAAVVTLAIATRREGIDIRIMTRPLAGLARHIKQFNMNVLALSQWPLQ